MFRRLRRKLLVSLLTLTALFVVGELWTRALEPGPFSLIDRYPYSVHAKGRGYERHQPDFEGRWDGTWYATNSLGLRGAEVPETAPGQVRVVCLGDSCTFGKGVIEEHTWPRQLESKLKERSGGQWTPVVANLGVNGYHGDSYQVMFDEVGKNLEPDLVLVGFNLNDFPNAISAVDEKVFRGRASRRLIPQGLRDAFGRFALYRWARQTFYHLRRDQDWANAEMFARGVAEGSPEDPVWQLQRRILRGIRDSADKAGARTALFLFPYESQVYLSSYDRTPIDRLRALCDEIGIPFVDLAEPFREAAREPGRDGGLFLRGDRYHPNPTGYELVAQQVIDQLEATGWLDELAADAGGADQGE